MKLIRATQNLLEALTLKSRLQKVEDKINRLRDDKEAAIDRMSSSMTDMSFDTLEERIAHMQSLDLQGDINMGLASESRRQEGILLTEEAKIRLFRRLLLLGLITGLGLLADWIFPTLGQDIESDYYSALVQIYPVLLIACYLNDATAKETPHYKLKEYIDTKFTAFCITVIGVAVSLFVIAQGQSSTFTLLLSIASLVFMLNVLMGIVRGHR